MVPYLQSLGRQVEIVGIKIEFVYCSKKLTDGTWTSHIWKGKSSFKPPFLGSMLVFGSVSVLIAHIFRCRIPCLSNFFCSLFEAVWGEAFECCSGSVFFSSPEQQNTLVSFCIWTVREKVPQLFGHLSINYHPKMGGWKWWEATHFLYK